MIEPYDFQATNIDEIRAFLRQWIWVLWYLPTGGGKSTAAAFMIQGAVARGKRCWFIVHRRELLKQTERLFASMGISYGVIAAGRDAHPSRLVQICSINTLSRRIESLEFPKFVVLDECHHLACSSWSAVLKRIGRVHLVGLSASPCRLDGRGLAEYFGALVKGPSPRELIDRGYLCKFRVFAPPTVDTSGLHIRAGDYITAESEALMDRPTITGSAVAEYKRLCSGKRALVFCCSIEHSKHVAAQFREAGIPAAHIDGHTSDDVRDMAVADFERGAISVLSNVDIAGEGLSINAIECIILLRPTASLGHYIQTVGRGLRTFPGKEMLTILDHVNSTIKFGMIDEPRDWQLTYDETTRKSKPKTSVRVCPACFAASSSRSRVCTNCGREFPVEPRQVEEREGELAEVTAEMLAKRAVRREQGRSQTLEQLQEFGRRKGYAPGWAIRVFQERQAKLSHE